MYEIKLQDIILYQISLIRQGLPKNKELDDITNEVSNLLLASQYVGNSDNDNLLIANKLNSVLALFQQQKPFLLNIFA